MQRLFLLFGTAGLILACGDKSDADNDGFTVAEGDCDDADASVYPGAVEEICSSWSTRPKATVLGSCMGPAIAKGKLDSSTSQFWPTCAQGGDDAIDAPDVSFLWTPPRAGEYCLDTDGSEFDTYLALLSAGDCTEELACDDDGMQFPKVSVDPMSWLSVTLEAEAVVIVIDSWDELSTGGYTLNIAEGPCE